MKIKVIMYICVLLLIISGCDDMKMDRKVAQQTASLQ